ncbi:MAG TPA: anaerobic nitric oxide reductase flavorubredoxin [Syntrophomonadaceae bacterium]|nr:anaerobic nitric oxide reductase flavorubredoxin [Syntrophomonadaceae bacterium]
MVFKITEKVSWVGKVDWDLETFHGEEYSTHKGSTYNAFLIQDEKNVLIDTVWGPFSQEFVSKLKKTIPLEKIDYIVMNHAEPDHSGALPELMKLIPNTPIYCTANGVKSIKGQYHQDWDFRVVKTGDKLNLGTRELIFIEAPMLHWPDSMFSYLTNDEILFSNDAFGQHYATEHMYNDLVDQDELQYECIKYYANILTPFSRLVARKIQEFVSLNLPVSFICPSHGVIWRDNPLQIVEKYNSWADSYQENQITILYDTMWDSTKKMAQAIARGVKAADPSITVKLYQTSKRDSNDILTEVFKSKAVFLGSPTVNKTILTSMAAMLEAFKGLRFTNKKAAAFGSYGWSGEAIKIISSRLEESGFAVIGPGVNGLWNPDAKAEENCYKLGQQMVEAL